MLSKEQQKLVEDNIKLVSFVIKLHDVEFNQDLYQQGCLGLCKAAKTFDPSKGFTFSTYATKGIWNEIGMDFRKINRHTKYLKNSISFDQVLSTQHGESVLVQDIIPDEQPPMDDLLYISDLKDKISQFTKTISPKDASILTDHLNGMTQKQISLKQRNQQSYISRRLFKIKELFIKYYEKGGR